MSNIIKFAVLLVGAILIALIVRVVVASATRPAGPAAVTTQKVQVSTADLPQGLLLREEDLNWKAVPVADVPPNAIVFGVQNAPQLKGALLRHPVAAGTVLVAEDVILPNAPGFLAATLKPEMRAVSVAVDDVSGNAGLIQPGDYVDLLLTQQMDRRTDSPDMAVSSETVVEHVRVLAVGSEISRPKNGTNGDTPDSMSRARTVTLEVTPRMGEVVAVAAHLGSLSLALRSFATASRDPAASGAAPTSTDERTPIWAGDISRAVRALPRAQKTAATINGTASVTTPAPRTVMIFRGSDKSDGTGSSVAQATGTEGAPPLPAAAAPTPR
jgi:pilus assembly protein CpaB